MYNYIIGRVVEKKEGILILENNGIGYELNVSNNTLCSLDNESECKLYTYLQVREDGISLFGFSTLEEKNMFLLLIEVSGVGPKMAISILSGVKISNLAMAIRSGDLSEFKKVKGCGKKTAERIIVELKDKIDAYSLAIEDALNADYTASIDMDVINEAVEVLVSLGTPKNEALHIARKVYTDGDVSENIVSKALLNM